MKRLVTTALAFAISAWCTGCGADLEADGAQHETFTIVATTGMIGDVARNIAGNRARVHTLMGPGVDPHSYRPTRSDVKSLLDADVVFYNGLHLEGRMTETFVEIARAGKPVFPVTELIDADYLLGSPDFPGSFDPHVWMDVRGWMVVTDVMTQVLINVDPEGESQYQSARAAYLRELESLDAWVRDAMATIPQPQRVLITAHDAFSYFARAYGIEVEAIQGISTESEAGLRRIESLVDLLVERQVKAIFTETSVPDKHIRSLIEGAHARGSTVAIGGALFSDAMGDAGSHEGTYIGMIEHNVRTIVQSLGGTLPDRLPQEQAEDTDA